MQKIILVERYLPSSLFWPNLKNNKRLVTLTVEEVLHKYQGFEGELISFVECSRNKMDVIEIFDQYFKKILSPNCLLLHVISDAQSMPLSLRNLAILVGYDVGVCEEEKTIYSSIFNEVLFGHLDELIVFKEMLNESLLFPSASLAEEYIALHNQLSIQGKGVEDYEEMKVYEIWKYKSL